MPNFQVLKCARDECGIYQVQQQKKVNKWVCKVCNQRQTLLRVYFESTAAKECREAVQSLNQKRHERQEIKSQLMQEASYHRPEELESKSAGQSAQKIESKWEKFESPSDSDQESSGEAEEKGKEIATLNSRIPANRAAVTLETTTNEESQAPIKRKRMSPTASEGTKTPADAANSRASAVLSLVKKLRQERSEAEGQRRFARGK